MLNHKYQFLIVWMVLFLAGIPCAKAGSEYRESLKSNVQFYIKAYGLADAGSNKLVKRACNVFEKVSQVADKRGNHIPSLKIVNSPGDPWTISLPDGNIVLSIKALEICYSDVSMTKGDARLAFIIGHELAHTANNDFWHMQTFMALSGDPDPWSKRLKKILEENSDALKEKDIEALSRSKEKEMAADDLGFMYAAISGFSMATLSLETNGDDFFTYWMAQTHTKIDISHPHPKERARLLQVKLKRLGEKIDFFEFGSRLAHFGRYEDAIYFLKEFQKIFPSREVFNNLGYCYLQMAIKKMPASLAYDYWFPWMIDISSLAESSLSRSGNEQKFISDQVKEVLNLSISCFESACKQDKLYLPSRLNLISAYFYLGEIYKARAVVEEALSLDPDNDEIKCLQAIVMMEEAPNVDMWPYVIEILKTLSGKENSPVSIQYNLARLLEKRKRNGEAMSVFKKLAEHPENLPNPFRLAVCEKVEGKSIPSPPPSTAPLPLSFKMPAKIGQDLQEDKEIQKQISNWERISFAWQNGMIKGDIYTLPDGTKILAVNGFVEMLIIKDRLGSVKDIEKRFGKPFMDKVWGKTVLSYSPKWSVMAEADQIKEIWISE
ncbi:MAG: hypothetical protein KJ737_22790 [Proteobacteria bacterium]|nr:hypothetical protein [Pseudomonadota bacterium]